MARGESSRKVKYDLRLSAELLDALKALAKANRREFADYLRVTLEDHVASGQTGDDGKQVPVDLAQQEAQTRNLNNSTGKRSSGSNDKAS